MEQDGSGDKGRGNDRQRISRASKADAERNSGDSGEGGEGGKDQLRGARQEEQRDSEAATSSWGRKGRDSRVDGREIGRDGDRDDGDNESGGSVCTVGQWVSG